MTRIFFFLITVCLSTFTLAAPSEKSVASVKKLIILGDSLTEGYGVAQEASFPKLLQKKIDQEKLAWTIVAAGSSGSTSASAIGRIKWIAKEKPDLVLMLLGSNDGLRGLDIKQTEKNLSEAIEWAQKNKIKILLGQLHAPPNYGKDYFDKFTKIYPNLAKKYKIELIPFLLRNVAGKSELNLADGIHPNEKGHQVIANDMYDDLKKLLK